MKKEEPKQERERGITITHVGKPKQETLEEAAEKYANKWYKSSDDLSEFLIGVSRNSFEHGAKWKQERMYSEEEVKHIISEALQSLLVTVDLEQWFEQFKKR